MSKSDYELLGVETDVSLSKLKGAYRKKAQIYHPDRGGSVQEFTVLNEAYERLLIVVKSKSPTLKRTIEKQTGKKSSLDTTTSPNAPEGETREEELKRIFHDPNYAAHHYFTPRYRQSEEQERAKRARSRRCRICGGRGFVRYNVRPELGSIGIEERLCSCQIVS